jgi:hypothetical protein
MQIFAILGRISSGGVFLGGIYLARRSYLAVPSIKLVFCLIAIAGK